MRIINSIKKIPYIFLAIIVCASMLMACMDYRTNSEAAKEDLEKLITCLDKNDHNGIKALFAPNRIADIQNFDEDISELLDIYKGNFVSHDFDLPALTEDDIDNNIQKKWFIIGADITTTEEVYHAVMYWCDMDTSDKGNVGIWSLFIFRKKDNPINDYSFYGDSYWSDENRKGIYVVKPYKYIDMTMNILQSGSVENVKTLFAPKVVSENSSFEKDVHNFFSYYTAEYNSCSEIASNMTVQSDADEMMTKRFRMFSYSIDTDDGKYSIALKYCDKDSENDYNIGLHSVYIRQGENSVDAPFWGDGLWTAGINVDLT